MRGGENRSGMTFGVHEKKLGLKGCAGGCTRDL